MPVPGVVVNRRGSHYSVRTGVARTRAISRIAGQGHLAHVRAPDVLAKHITDAVH